MEVCELERLAIVLSNTELGRGAQAETGLDKGQRRLEMKQYTWRGKDEREARAA